MPYVDFTRFSPDNLDFTWERVWGTKLTPYIRSQVRPMDYRKEFFEYITGSPWIATQGVRAGGGLWGDKMPVHQQRGMPGYKTVDFLPIGNQAYARAYTKFKDKIYTQAANLTALKERGKTVEMLLSRLSQLHKGAKALKKGRFQEFLRTFGIQSLPAHKHKRWSRPQDFGALWLEYWMGWAPTVGDVYTSLEFLDRRIPDQPVRAGSSVPYTDSSSQSDGYAEATSTWEGKCTVWVQGSVEVTNPTLHLLQGLGLLNPFKTVWETIPFSWFADWFTNVGQVLGQLTDWVGLKLSNLIVSCKTEAVCSWSLENAPRIYYGNPPYFLYRYRNFVGFSRTVLPSGIMPEVKPKLTFLKNGLSITRGATLCSLLVTMFSPKKA